MDEYSIPEFFAAIAGYNEEMFNYWDMTRRIMYAAGTWEKGTTPQSLLPLPIDKTSRVSKDEIDRAREILNKLRQ